MNLGVDIHIVLSLFLFFSWKYKFIFNVEEGFKFEKSKEADRAETKSSANKLINNNKRSGEGDCESPPLPTPIDWKPQKNCYFCVDGKLLTVNDKGDLVAETGSVHTGPDLVRRVSILSNF